MDKFVVYLHRNMVNGKVYVGVTCQANLNDRWRKGKAYNKAFKADVERYGWNNFKHIIVISEISQEEALQKEKELVDFFESNKPENGYNITKGGDVMGMMGKHHSMETKKRLHEKMDKIAFSEEHKKRISEAKQGIKHHCAKPVYQFTMSGEYIRKWDYMSEASKTLNINKGNITETCKGNRKSAGGFIWKYERGKHEEF